MADTGTRKRIMSVTTPETSDVPARQSGHQNEDDDLRAYIHPSIHPFSPTSSAAGLWRPKSQQIHPSFQLFQEDIDAFPSQPRVIVPPASPESSPGTPPGGNFPEHLPRKASRRHPKQTPEPPQLAPLNVEEQQLNSELLPGDRAPHPISMGALTKGAHMSANVTSTDGPSLSSVNEEYNMTKKRRGCALIFNQEYFESNLKLGYRQGSDQDRNKLVERLEDLNFEVQAYNNLTQKGVANQINKAAKADHSDADCFLVVFLSHGEKDYVYAKDGPINIKDITDRFKGNVCEKLVGKPKIFIWQACRGNQFDESVTATDGDFVKNDVVVDTGAVYTLPAGADFIMCYSVAEGFYSFRNLLNGSWYIQDLCELLRQYGNSLEFTHLLTLANKKVSMRSTETPGDKIPIVRKQVPCFASMLTKKLYFRPKSPMK